MEIFIPFNSVERAEKISELGRKALKEMKEALKEGQILHPAEPMRVGSLVRWPEYPDRLYYIREMGVKHCGREDYVKIETIDHKWVAVLPVTDLVLDDVDYDEVERP